MSTIRAYLKNREVDKVVEEVRRDPRRVQEVILALGDTDTVVRWSAADALGEIGPVTADVIPSLIRALGDLREPIPSEKRTRNHAADALVKIGNPSIPALKKALDDERIDVNIQVIAGQTLAKIGGIDLGKIVREAVAKATKESQGS